MLATGERKVLLPNGFDPRFVPPNRLLFGRGTNLMMVGFNPETLTVSGNTIPVLQELDLRAGFSGFSAQYEASLYDLSRNGTMVYIRGNQQTTENKLVWAEHDAKPQPFPLKSNVYESPRFLRTESKLRSPFACQILTFGSMTSIEALCEESPSLPAKTNCPFGLPTANASPLLPMGASKLLLFLPTPAARKNR